MKTESLINRTIQKRIDSKERIQNNYQTVKRFFQQVEEKDGKHIFQDVVVTHFEQSRETAKNIK